MFGKKLGIVALGCFLIGGLSTGCGPDDDPVVSEFTGYIQHFAGDDKVPGMVVEAVNNSTGVLLGISATSDSSGYVTFSGLPTGKVGFLCKGVAEAWVDTYQFNIDSDAQDERLWAVDVTTYTYAPLGAGVTMVPGQAVLAGGLYWVEDGDTEEKENHVGCATVEADPEDGDVRYFNNQGNPTPLVGEDGRDTTNPLIAYFLVANMDPVKQTVNAYMGEDEIGSTSLFMYADSISISNIYTDGSQPNPMPELCE